MKTLYFIPLMAIASGLLIYALIYTNYNEPLINFNEVEESPILPLNDIGQLKFKLDEDQLSKLDCSVLGPGTETYLMIDNELYVFECPDERFD